VQKQEQGNTTAAAWAGRDCGREAGPPFDFAQGRSDDSWVKLKRRDNGPMGFSSGWVGERVLELVEVLSVDDFDVELSGEADEFTGA
jgi:hypothetical protein